MPKTKRITILISGLMILSIFWGVLGNPENTFAQTDDTPPNEVEISAALAERALSEYSFADLGYEDITLNGPFDSAQVRFGLPADWRLTPGASIELELAFYYSFPQAESPIEIGEIFGGLLQLTFNGLDVTNVLLDQRGDRSVTAAIPLDALAVEREDGRQILQFNLISDESCLYGVDTVVVIKPTSRVIIPHTTAEVNTDLAVFPRPIFQENLIVPEIATFVVPDQPSSLEMRAALAVVAGFGRLSDEDLLFTLVPRSELSTEYRNSTHIVFIGKAAGLPELTSVNLPVPPGSFIASNGNVDDGIVQMAVSPWNSSKAVMVVSGETDAGVYKSAQAVSSGIILGIDEPNVARIAEINPLTLIAATPANRTFADLGYQTETINRYGAVSRDFYFYVPPGQIPQGDSYIELFYAHSTLLDYNESGVVVELNGDPIGSNNFTEETSQNSTLKANIPASQLRPGRNRLTVNFGLIPADICAEFLVDNLWFTISSESLIHLPLVPMPQLSGARTLDLEFFPDLFTLSPENGSVAFVLPQNDSNAWQAAAQLAFNMGDDTDWTLAEFATYYENEVTDSVRQNHDLILVGLPTSLPLISELANAMPAPIEVGTNVAVLDDMQVSYRLPASSNLGYVQLFESPWNSNRAVLAVLGSSPNGVTWAGYALSSADLRSEFSGDLALVNGEQILAMDSRLSYSAGSVALDVPAAEVEVPVPDMATDDTPEVVSRPGWLLPALIGVVALMLLVVVFAMINGLKNRGRR
jgi:cellulose synthase operon protein B